MAIPQEKLKIDKVNGLGTLRQHLRLGAQRQSRAVLLTRAQCGEQGARPYSSAQGSPGSQGLFPTLINMSHLVPIQGPRFYSRFERKVMCWIGRKKVNF